LKRDLEPCNVCCIGQLDLSGLRVGFSWETEFTDSRPLLFFETCIVFLRHTGLFQDSFEKETKRETRDHVCDQCLCGDLKLISRRRFSLCGDQRDQTEIYFCFMRSAILHFSCKIFFRE
jgi:hypothetical protein